MHRFYVLRIIKESSQLIKCFPDRQSKRCNAHAQDPPYLEPSLTQAQVQCSSSFEDKGYMLNPHIAPYLAGEN